MPSLANSEFHFVPLRNLWCSLIDPEDLSRDGRFCAAQSPNPARLVGNYKFIDEFWSEELNAQQRGQLTPDQAWFGIRSILKGGQKGQEIDIFEPHHFRQLQEGDDERGVIPGSATKDFFTNDKASFSAATFNFDG